MKKIEAYGLLKHYKYVLNPKIVIELIELQDYFIELKLTMLSPIVKEYARFPLEEPSKNVASYIKEAWWMPPEDQIDEFDKTEIMM